MEIALQSLGPQTVTQTILASLALFFAGPAPPAFGHKILLPVCLHKTLNAHIVSLFKMELLIGAEAFLQFFSL